MSDDESKQEAYQEPIVSADQTEEEQKSQLAAKEQAQREADELAKHQA